MRRKGAADASRRQIDPPEADALRLKGGAVCFVNAQAWLLSAARSGQFLHILADLMDQLAAKRLRPPDVRLFRLEQAADALHEWAELAPGRRVLIAP